MIRRFALRDFKGHRDTQLELGRLTMLVGDNASGKTSVLEALELQARFGADAFTLLRGDLSPTDLLRRGSKGPIAFDSEGMTGGSTWSTQAELRVAPNVLDATKIWELAVAGTRGEIGLRAGVRASESTGDSTSGWDQVRSVVGTARIYSLRAEQISAAAYSEVLEVPISRDGTNTAVALAAMKLGNDEVFERLETAMRKVVPALTHIRIRPALVNYRNNNPPVSGYRLYFDFLGAPGVPAHGASQGTLLVLALLAVLYGPRRPDLILLDDFDHALHPRAQMELVRMIKQLLTLDDFADVQVVATTHSPYMLDELDPSDVQAFALRDDGTVASKRLSEHPEAERTRGTLKAGQLWSLDPERDWVLRD
jgi:predicted ATPase